VFRLDFLLGLIGQRQGAETFSLVGLANDQGPSDIHLDSDWSVVTSLDFFLNLFRYWLASEPVLSLLDLS
jgi:hypothetical protein